jgi:nitrate reductase gamma subunit
MLDEVLYVAVPYVAVIIAVVGGIARYFGDRFSYSSQSSQFLESRTLFWGSVPWHYGIIVILLAHVLILLIPSIWRRIIAPPTVLYVVEVVGLAFALSALVGLVALIVRRINFSRIRTVTSVMDWVLLALLLSQVLLGIWVALFFRWGAEWGAYKAAPWILSLVTLQPEIDNVSTLPGVVQLHILGGFLIIAIFPFTRLVHLVTFPITYLWRPYQVVIWNKDRKKEKVGVG